MMKFLGDARVALTKFSQRFYKWLVGIEVLAAAYFVALSAIQAPRITNFLQTAGFREDMAKAISDSLYSLGLISIVLCVLVVCRVSVRLRSDGAKKLQAEIDVLTEQNAKLTETLASLTPNLRSVYTSVLETILRRMNLDSTPDVRISAYIPSSDKEHFTPVGRFSYNAIHRLQGRTQLPFSEGCIGKAWSNGKEVWSEMSLTKEVRGKRALQNYQIPLGTFNNLRMNTVSLGAYRIEDGDNNPIAIIVIEAEKHGIINFDNFSRVLDDERVNLQRLIGTTQRYLTDPALAREADV
ncbi:hypothetical protein [Thioclava sp. GXIMD4215]|uniref:hypothetical protein n=1 Tax=Thioclava sp. GXIMD4215 TaxID=3131928 RepID=UPI003246339B